MLDHRIVKTHFGDVSLSIPDNHHLVPASGEGRTAQTLVQGAKGQAIAERIQGASVHARLGIFGV